MTLVCFLLSPGAAQTTAESQSQVSPDDWKKFSGVFSPLGGLLQKMRARVELPAPRNLSRLLPLLPESTLVYVAIPNYGEASHQALTVFQEEIKENAELRAWWQKGDMATEGPKMEENLERFYQLSQYLGDEIVISAASSGKEDPKFLILAEVRKPGLKDFLRQGMKDVAGKSKPAARVFDAAELAAAKNVSPDQPVILVGPDLVVLAENLNTLRTFNARQEHAAKDFASTEFGQRLVQGYEGGTTIIAGADFQRILKLSSTSLQKDPTFQRTGFSDVKYLVWEHKNVDGQAVSQTELSFTGPRRGVASWLAAPAPMGSLDFVSPKALMAVAIHLKNPTETFDDLRDLSTASNPNAFAAVDQMDEALKLSLRDDVLAQLGGEITLEMDGLVPPNPVWKVILKANDPAKLSAALSKVLTATHISAEFSEEDGVTYHTFRIPSPQKTTEIGYAFVDGYLVLASSRETLAEAVRLHRSGESLARNQKFLASLPPGSSAESSALIYEDPVAMAALTMRQASPEMAELFSHFTTEGNPVVMSAYGEESALREVSRSGGVDAGAVLVVAAVAIPNLLRARIAANESSAVAMIRTANTAQITYASAYPQRGYARDLATLGPDPSQVSASTENHASFIDATLGNPSCTAGAWCTKSGFQFTITSLCKQRKCDEYVVVGTPVSASTGTRNFCSTSEAVIRFKGGPPLTSPVSVSECLRWTPLQ
jgi:type II secretory pathway pseudopilin PulG